MFLYLSSTKQISPSRAAVEAGISKSLVTKWKNNGTEIPSPDVIKKLTSYFGVSSDYLLGFTLESSLDLLKYRIEKLQQKIDVASDDEKEKLESELCILRESYEDQAFALYNGANNDANVSFALYGDTNITSDVYDEITAFAEYAKNHKKKAPSKDEADLIELTELFEKLTPENRTILLAAAKGLAQDK